MQRSWWLAGALGAVLAASGCGQEQVKSDTAMLGRIPMDQKQPIFTAQNNLQVAQANVQSAQRAVDESRAFQDVASKQVDAAKARVAAAQKAFELGQKMRDPQQIQAARGNFDIAQREVTALQTKKSYADRLVELRSEQVNLAQKEADLADSQLAIARVEVLQQQGYRPKENVADLVKARNDKQAEIAAIRGRLGALDQQVAQLRVAWQQQRRSYNVAARNFTPPPTRAPQGPERVPLQRIPEVEQAVPVQPPAAAPKGDVQFQQPSPPPSPPPPGTYMPQRPPSNEGVQPPQVP